MAPAGTRPQYMYTLMGCPSAALGSRPRGSLPPHNSYKNLRMCLERKETRMRTCPRTVTVSPIGRKRTRYIPSSWYTPLPPLDRGHEGPLTPTPQSYKKRKNVASKETASAAGRPRATEPSPCPRPVAHALGTSYPAGAPLRRPCIAAVRPLRPLLALIRTLIEA